MEKLKEEELLAQDHWDYIETLLYKHGLKFEILNVIGFHYKSAFIHGYKHGVTDSKSSPMMEDENIFKELQPDKM